jgi:ABC-type Fe3+-siderophore transport system permease subunit
MAISGKVTASTVAAAGTTIVAGIIAPHVFQHSVPSDVRGLIEGGVTAVITFVSGYLARHGIAYEKLAADTAEVAADLGVPFMALSDVTEEKPAPDMVAEPAPVAAVPAAPVAEAQSSVGV